MEKREYALFSKLQGLFGNQSEKNIYSTELLSVCLFCDNKKMIDVSNERLIEHFPARKTKESITVKTSELGTDNEWIEHFLLTNFRNSDWIQRKHMGGYFFNVKSQDGVSITIWCTKHNPHYGVKTFSPNQMIESVFQKKEEGMCVLVEINSDIFLLYTSEDPYTDLVPMRLIRSLLMRPFILQNYVYFHSAAIKYKGVGVLLCGGSGYGKTTTLLQLLSSKECQIVANDKVFIKHDTLHNAVVWGWPTVVTLGVGTMSHYEELKRFLTDISDVSCLQDLYGYNPNRAYLTLTDEEMKALPKEGNKLVISHKQLANLFKRSICAKCEIHAIISVNLKWDSEENKLIEILDISEKEKIIQNNILRNISDQLSWAGYPELNSNENDINTLTEITKSVKFFELQANFNDASLANFLEQVVDYVSV